MASFPGYSILACTRHAHRELAVCFEQPPKGIPRVSPESSQDLNKLLSSMRSICDDIQTYTSRFAGQTTTAPSLKRSKGRVSSVETNPTNKMHLANFAHSFDMAKVVLQESGILSRSSSGCTETNEYAPRTTEETCFHPNSDQEIALEAAQVIIEIGHSAASRYLKSFMDIVYPAYPCINIDLAKKTLDAIFKIQPPAQEPHSPDGGVDLIDIEICKIVLAVGIMVQEDSPCTLGVDLETYLIWTTDTVMKRDQVQVEDVIISTLLVGITYHAFSNSLSNQELTWVPAGNIFLHSGSTCQSMAPDKLRCPDNR